MIGVLEAIITVIVIASLERVRPDLLAWNQQKLVDDSESKSPQEIVSK
jgi:hypothetical protein